MKDDELERLLHHALSSAPEPGELLNQQVTRHMQDDSRGKNVLRKKYTVGLFVAALLLTLSISAYAAVQFLRPDQVATHIGDTLLAEAFQSKEAVPMNQTASSGEYVFTLHGLVSGASLSGLPHSSEELYPSRTYAVVSISRQDGVPMPDTSDPEYGQDPFFISPLIKGQEPWRVNIASMNGGYHDIVIDGIMYRLIACDQVEIFADRGIYLAISSGSPFYSTAAFEYDAATGEVHARADYAGASLLFDLPLDASKADPKQAQNYLEDLLNPQSERNKETSGTEPTGDIDKYAASVAKIREAIRNGDSIGETVEGSVQEVDYDESGNITFEYDGIRSTVPLETVFEEGHTGFSTNNFPMSGDGHRYIVVLFHRDDQGTITARHVVLDPAYAPQ